MVDKILMLPSLLPRKTTVAMVLVFLIMICKGFAQDTTALLIIKNVPLVLGTINDQPAYFLVDTGASVTLLNESLQGKYNFEVVENWYLVKHEIVGMGGKSPLREARTARIKIGAHDLHFINKASDLEKISNEFAAFNITIAGIIGTDLLTVLGSVIDLELKIIVFRSKSQLTY